ncbi:hypothetical protein GGS21DRAFT_519866 [Xylaria nigripes]|nr:hypothetical protein GGS21DRAFT_519866 [Xylaria nigripes]
MGKPSDNSFADGVVLQSNPGQSSSTAHFVDAPDINDDPEINIDDVLPNYSDAIQFSESAPMLAPRTAMNDNVRPLDLDAFVIVDKNTGAQAWVAKSVEDPASLEEYINQLSSIPPRPHIRVVGTHTETSRDSKGKTEKNTVTDFDVAVDLTPYLYANAQYRTAWTQIQTVDNGAKVRRGTALRKRGPGSNQSIEVGADAKPTIREWCHRFAASPARLKCFTLQRKVTGFDEEGIKQRLAELVRRTNYRGRLQVELVMKDSEINFYNNAGINRWRLTPWIRWFFFLTFLFIFSWPYLFFRTKRWEVVTVDWPFSRINESGRKEYVSLSEEQWYNLWGQAICRAVLQRRQTVLDQSDLRAAHQGEPAFNTGNGRVDDALGVFRASVNAMNEVNRQLGWGEDC